MRLSSAKVTVLLGNKKYNNVSLNEDSKQKNAFNLFTNIGKMAARAAARTFRFPPWEMENRKSNSLKAIKVAQSANASDDCILH